MNSISLIGFMGSGKTTTAKLLNTFFMDHKLFSIDEEIEKNTSFSIKEIFEKYGEIHFRNLENEMINQVISNNKNIILDLGGGAFIQEKNRILLKEKSIISIFLDVPFNEICKRLEGQQTERPLLKSENWKEKAKILFNERYETYKKADKIISIKENQNKNEVVSLVKNFI